MKKILSFVLALCMICTLLPATALVANAATEEVVFEFGANKNTTTHADGSSKTTYTEKNGNYTLTLGNVTNFYTGANDAKGNSCIKLGASSKTGGFSFTVPADVTSVIIAIAGYKAKNVTVKINNVSYAVSELSNNGKYKEIEIDTTTNKTVTLITTSTGYRAMVNSITYVIAASESDCKHENKKDTIKAANCTEAGETSWECPDCGAKGSETIPALGHKYGDFAVVEEATCIKTGLQEKTCENCGDTVEETIPLAEHNYEDGICSECGAEEPQTIEESYTFSNYAAGTQYAENEEHKLSDNVTIYTTDCHFTTQLRIYSSSSNNGYAVIQSALPITKIVVNAGYKVDTLNVYGSNDEGATWTLIEGISVTGTSYKNYSLELGSTGYKYLKLDVDGTQQVRVASMTLTLNNSSSGEQKVPATATFNGAAADISGNVGDTITMPEYTGTVMKGYTFAGWSKDVVEGENRNVSFVQAGVSYDLTGEDAFYALFSRTEKADVNDTYKLYTGELVEGDYLIANNSGNRAMTATVDKNRFQYADVVIAVDNTIQISEASAIWHITPNGDYYTFYNAASGKYAGGTGDTGEGALLGSVTDYALWEVTNGNTAVVENKGNKANDVNYTLRNNSTYGFATYAPQTGEAPAFYKAVNEVIYYTTNPQAILYTNGSNLTKYNTWNEELSNATSGKIILCDDITVNTVDLNAGVVLDLNGCTVNASSITATVKDSADGKGLIKIAQESAVLTSVNGQLILWDNTANASGYRVFNYTFANRGIDADGTDAEQTASAGILVKSFWSDLEFSNANAYKLVAASDLEVGFKLQWNGTEKTFWFDTEVTNNPVAAWAAAEESNADAKDYCFYITVTGFEGLETTGDLVVTPMIATAFDSIVTNPITYTVE